MSTPDPTLSLVSTPISQDPSGKRLIPGPTQYKIISLGYLGQKQGSAQNVTGMGANLKPPLAKPRSFAY